MSYTLELPDIGEGVVEAEVMKWFVAEGDEVIEDQPLVEVMTDKATVTIPSPRRGRVTRLHYEEGQIARVHHPLLELELEAVGPARPPAPVEVAAAAPTVTSTAAHPARTATPAATAAPQQKPLATPAVRAMARQMGIDVQTVQGTGPGGRVTKEDLSQVRNGHVQSSSSSPAP